MIFVLHRLSCLKNLLLILKIYFLINYFHLQFRILNSKKIKNYIKNKELYLKIQNNKILLIIFQIHKLIQMFCKIKDLDCFLLVLFVKVLPISHLFGYIKWLKDYLKKKHLNFLNFKLIKKARFFKKDFHLVLPIIFVIPP